jgi:hypothetical protein
MMHQICLKLNPYPPPFSAVYKWFQAYFETVQSHCSSWLSGYSFQITAGGITDCKDWSHHMELFTRSEVLHPSNDVP